MSSPPQSATSPTYPTNLSLKRPPAGAPGGSASSLKRRKPSTLSNSSHPLRNTSFPPADSTAIDRGFDSQPRHGRTASFSPSVNSIGGFGSKTGSVAGGGKKKSDARSAAASTTAKGGEGSRSRTGAEGSVRGGEEGSRQYQDDEDGEEDEDEDENAYFGDGGKMDEAAEKQEDERIAMLINAFNEDQNQRYATFKWIKPKKEVVRRTVNHTLSQSVPPSVINTISWFTKVFIGDIIEGALDVQTEWMAASPTLPNGELKPHVKRKRRAASETQPMSRLSQSNSPAMRDGAKGGDLKSLTPGNDANGAKTPVKAESTELDVDDGVEAKVNGHVSPPLPDDRFDVDERDRGPLLPDHLREALRRYKKERGGGSAGFRGLSMEGKIATASRTGGKRLFR